MAGGCGSEQVAQLVLGVALATNAGDTCGMVHACGTMLCHKFVTQVRVAWHRGQVGPLMVMLISCRGATDGRKTITEPVQGIRDRWYRWWWSGWHRDGSGRWHIWGQG